MDTGNYETEMADDKKGRPACFNPNLNQLGPTKTSTRFLFTTLPVFLWE